MTPARVAKRAIDIAVSSVTLAAGAPVLLAIGALIRLDSPGPALFRQARVGRGGRHFDMLKFRTMIAAPVQFNPDGSTRVAVGDARVTRVGRRLRGALDELPQLWNVLRGDMSLVGPRPDMPVHVTQYTVEERRKLAVRPGMTSLAAVLGRNQIPWRKRIAIDLRYLDAWSLGLDLKIVAQTLCLPIGARPFSFAGLVDGLDVDA